MGLGWPGQRPHRRGRTSECLCLGVEPLVSCSQTRYPVSPFEAFVEGEHYGAMLPLWCAN